MKLFETYTGSAFLNQALLTIQDLAGKSILAELDTDDMLRVFEKPYKSAPFSLTSINRRLKSYTMVFTKNGPLHNDKENGKTVYESLMRGIFSNPENKGDKLCELSGLRFSTSFETHYLKALERVHYTKDKIAKKDLTINRCWFPLIGGLGSDAQALPQASFAVNIHPICLAILQFLPLCALLYKGGVLLVDSPNISFTKDIIAYFVERVQGAITTINSEKAIENIKDFSKGHYIILALSKLSAHENSYDNTSGFNFWSFSNSGTGANCFIDRIPNRLIKKLRLLYSDHRCKNDLENILRDSKKSDAFLTALDDNKDFWGLYPAKDYEGVNTNFFERYQQIIGNDKRIAYTKYISQLLCKQTLTKDEKKLLAKTDAYAGENRKKYTVIIKKLLREAAEKGLWHPLQHLEILDNNEITPVSSSTVNIYPMVHYYYQKWENDSEEMAAPSIPEEPNTVAYAGVKVFLFLLGQDKDERTKKQLMEYGYQKVTFNELLWRTGSKYFDFEQLYPLLYDRENRQNKAGLRELLRVFLVYNKGNLSSFNDYSSPPAQELSDAQQGCIKRLQTFCEAYFNYYCNFKNNNSKDLSAFRLHVLKPMIASGFQVHRWLDDTLENTKKASEERTLQVFDFSKKSVFSEALLYDHTGDYNPHFAHFAITYHLHRFYHQSHKTKQPQHG